MSTPYYSLTPVSGDALLIVDVQNDFLPGGSLAVPEADQVVPVLNRSIGLFRERGLPILASRDWHPPDHCSFRIRGGPWPPHCQAGTEGAAFPPQLKLPETALIISKATHSNADAYSAFEGTDLKGQLDALGIERLFVGGLATDYCVLNTVLDALKSGLQVILLEEAIRAVNRDPGDGARAIETMQDHGARLARLAHLA